MVRSTTLKLWCVMWHFLSTVTVVQNQLWILKLQVFPSPSKPPQLLQLSTHVFPLEVAVTGQSFFAGDAFVQVDSATQRSNQTSQLLSNCFPSSKCMRKFKTSSWRFLNTLKHFPKSTMSPTICPRSSPPTPILLTILNISNLRALVRNWVKLFGS